MSGPKQDCAVRVIQAFPALMQAIISEVEGHGPTRLSYQQFRALMFIAQQNRPNLSMIGEHLNATPSATSKLMDGLIQNGYVSNATAPHDRRIKLFSLTPLGQEEIHSHHKRLIVALSRKLDKLTESERAMIILAMDVLQAALKPVPTHHD